MGTINFQYDMSTAISAGHIYDQIGKNSVGQVIIDGIKATSHDLTFTARKEASVKRNKCDAETSEASVIDAAPWGAGKVIPWYKGYDYDPTQLGNEERRNEVVTKAVGTGKGSDVTISFNPEDAKGCANQDPSSAPDEVLFHEMVHALRCMQGMCNRIPTVNGFYDNDEEFLAIVVTNVYISCKNPKLPLRANHKGKLKMSDSLSLSKGFLADRDNKYVLLKYCIEWQDTFKKLAALTRPQFNPFRQMEADF